MLVTTQIYNFLKRRYDFIKHKAPFDNCPECVRLRKCSLIYWFDVQAGDAILPDEGYVISHHPEAEICENCRKEHSKTR